MDNFQEQEYYVVSSTTNPFSKYLDIDLSRGFSHVVVTSACIPKTFYVIPKDATLTVKEGNKSFDVIIPAGNYSLSNFPTLFAFLINNVSVPAHEFFYSVTFPNSSNVQTGKFTFNVSLNYGVQPTFTVKDRYLARVMGFNYNTEVVFANNKLVSTNVINFQSYDELLIISDMVENKRNLLQELYVSQNLYNSSIIWNNYSLPLNAKKLAPTSSNVYSFALVDEENSLIDLNGSEFSFILMFFKTNDLTNVIKKYIAVSLLENQNKNLE
jgi:hypothetical protein